MRIVLPEIVGNGRGPLQGKRVCGAGNIPLISRKTLVPNLGARS
jgi:hypothetical protein